MRIRLAVLVIATLSAPALAAEDGAFRGGWQPYGLPAAKSGAKVARDPLATPALPPRESMLQLKPGGACGRSDLEVCLDSSGRLTVPGARRFLPQLPGLTPERLTLKRRELVFRYSF